ncbi:MAG: glutamine cyclotransferase [Chitinophagaceae bacterium]
MRNILTVATIFLLVSCNNGGKGDNPPDTSNSNKPLIPASFNYQIQKTYPHDTASFTQGLVVYKGSMYEGTGEYGSSKLLKVDIPTGKALKSISLDKKYFGEGITILNDTIYQLTWKEHIVFAYSLNNFKKLKEFPIATDGWGITTDGTNLIVSDGSSDLYYYEPQSFKLIKKITVTDSGSPAYNINELEFINGFIYANQWQLPYLMKIDPATAQVVAKADLTEIWRRIKDKNPAADVPNGIAYNAATKKIYITGKKWPELYEVTFQ